MTADDPGASVDRTPADLTAAACVRRRFRQAQVEMARALGKVDLTALQYHLLLELGCSSDERSQGDLALCLSVPEARLSALVRSLSERELVRASRSRPDRRVVRLRLTGRGRRLLVRALEEQRHALVTLVVSIPEPEMNAMVEWGMREYLVVPPQPGSPRGVAGACRGPHPAASRRS